MDIAIMIEGQNGLNWQRWKKVAKAVEDLGFFGLYRSDHFTNSTLPDKDSLELWVSLTWLADNTRSIQFGPLVTPFSFRHPVFTARMASAVDDLSGGRLTLGLGAGWQQREHDLYGYELLDMGARFDRMEEGIKVIEMLFKKEQHFSFKGNYYQANEAILLPRPLRLGGPPLLIGGNGLRRSLPFAAKYAIEWNAMFLTSEKFLVLNKVMDKLLQAMGREPKTLKRSMMTGIRYGRTKKELESKLAASNQQVEDLRNRGIIVGVGEEIKTQLVELERAGLQCIILQWLDLDDLDGLKSLAKAVL